MYICFKFMTKKTSSNRNLLSYIREQKLSLILSSLFIVMTAFFAPLKSFIFQWLIESQTKNEVIKSLVIGIGVVASSNVCEFISRNIFSKVSSKATANIRNELIDILHSIPLNVYESSENDNKSKWISALTNETRIIEEDYYRGLFDMTIWGCIGLAAIVYMSTISTILLLVALLLASLPFFVPRLLAPYLSKTKENNTKAFNHLCTKVKEFMDGYETLVINKKQPYMKEKMRNETTSISKSEYEMRNANNVSSTVTSLVSWFPGFALLVAGTFLVLEGKVSLGYLISANTLINFILIPFRQVANAYISVQSTLSIRKKINTMLNEENAFISNEQRIHINDILINNLSFCYQNKDKPILKSINMTIEKGSKIAILGDSGCGKSTLLRIMAKFYTSYEGIIKASGEDIRDLSDGLYFQYVSLIPQNPYIFEDTLKNNICLGECFTDEDINYAIRLSGLSSFVESLPDGFSTILNERGTNISGGQKKRIAIARALVRNCEILLVDEVTSSLDIETTNSIVKNLIKLPCSVVMVTHDVFESYMPAFDRIYYISKGEISEFGTYSELIDRKGLLYHAVTSMKTGDMTK